MWWQLQRLLPCEHFHAVFTLPHVFLPLWQHNRAWLNARLFDCTRQALLELCADARHLGATPGLLLALHSWGRDLSLHPHVHALISAGGLDSHGQWRNSRAGYLVPVKALQALFRGKLLHALSRALTEQRLHLPEHLPLAHWRWQIRSQYRKHWNIHLGQRYSHGRGVALYLARYVKGGPLPAQRPLQLHQQHVVLPYTDHRDGRRKRARYSVEHFIERVLWHAAPRGQHLVRHCGLYCSSARPHHLAAVSQLRTEPIPAPLQPLAAIAAVRPICPSCARPLQPVLSLLPTHRVGEFYKARPPATTEWLGPTLSSSGNATAGSSQALRRRSLRRRIPLN
ncbi:MAG: transposase [Ideonella sp.]|nr:transposase [Ideonella sp.]